MTQFASLADGRQLAYDDVGDSDGQPVVYLHGCPNARLSRHPDDDVATRCGVRLIAVDRPGYGESDALIDDSLISQGRDLLAFLDALALDRCAVFAWSAGAPSALALAHIGPERLAHVAIACGTMPNPSQPLTDTELAEVVSLIVPAGVTYELALEMTREGAGEAYLRDLDAVPGLDEQLARATVAGVASGTSGTAGDIRVQTSPWPFDLSGIDVRVSLWYGERDEVVSPAVGDQLTRSLPNARLEVVPGASHLLPLTHWSEILCSLRKEPSCR
jgi:pimeloyl-ACP methyl ester carboxylesterase